MFAMQSASHRGSDEYCKQRNSDDVNNLNFAESLGCNRNAKNHQRSGYETDMSTQTIRHCVPSHCRAISHAKNGFRSVNEKLFLRVRFVLVHTHTQPVSTLDHIGPFSTRNRYMEEVTIRASKSDR